MRELGNQEDLLYLRHHLVETVEIPTSNITKIRLKHLKNDIKLNELYIGTVPTEDDTNKDIDITPDKTTQ